MNNSKILIFICGLVLSWVVWSSIYYYKSKPIDISSGLDDAEINMISGLVPWFSDSIAGGYGKYILLSSKSNKKDIMVFNESKTFPFVIISSKEDGAIVNIQVVDSENRILSVTDSDFDSSFNSFDLSVKDQKGGYSLIDKDFDGSFDIKIFDDGRALINKDGKWDAVTNNKTTESALDNGQTKEQ